MIEYKINGEWRREPLTFEEKYFAEDTQFFIEKGEDMRKVMDDFEKLPRDSDKWSSKN